MRLVVPQSVAGARLLQPRRAPSGATFARPQQTVHPTGNSRLLARANDAEASASKSKAKVGEPTASVEAPVEVVDKAAATAEQPAATAAPQKTAKAANKVVDKALEAADKAVKAAGEDNKAGGPADKTAAAEQVAAAPAAEAPQPATEKPAPTPAAVQPAITKPEVEEAASAPSPAAPAKQPAPPAKEVAADPVAPKASAPAKEKAPEPAPVAPKSSAPAKEKAPEPAPVVPKASAPAKEKAPEPAPAAATAAAPAAVEAADSKSKPAVAPELPTPAPEKAEEAVPVAAAVPAPAAVGDKASTSGGYTLLGPDPQRFTVAQGELLNVASAAFPALVRLGSGGFSSGYSSGLEADDGSSYAVVKAASRSVVERSKVGSFNRPAQPIVLYEFETCPFCRKVREAVGVLDLDVLFLPCPKGGQKWREEAAARGGKAMFPYMVDPNEQVEMYESDDIIRYLFNNYGPGEDAIPRLLRLGALTTITCGVALLPRGGRGGRARAYKLPEQPLVFWGYELSPFCKIVREVLCELQLPHIQRTCSRGSPKRQELLDKVGHFQVPYLEDPNTGYALFESSAIVRYLEYTYAEEPRV